MCVCVHQNVGCFHRNKIRCIIRTTRNELKRYCVDEMTKKNRKHVSMLLWKILVKKFFFSYFLSLYHMRKRTHTHTQQTQFNVHFQCVFQLSFTLYQIQTFRERERKKNSYEFSSAILQRNFFEPFFLIHTCFIEWIWNEFCGMRNDSKNVCERENMR